jgi:hypothetical protein
LKASCCSYTSSGNVIACEECSIDTDTGDYYNCHDITVEKSPTTGIANVPQGGGALEQPEPKHQKYGGTTLPEGGGTVEQPQSSKHSPKDNTKLPNDNSGSVDQQEQSSPLQPLKPKGGHNINPAIG